MRSFNLINRLLGRSATTSPFVNGECLSSLRASMKTDHAWIVPEGVAVVPSPPEPKYPEAERIAASIRDFPEDWGWARKGFDLIHVPSGFKLWAPMKIMAWPRPTQTMGRRTSRSLSRQLSGQRLPNGLGTARPGSLGDCPRCTSISPTVIGGAWAKGIPGRAQAIHLPALIDPGRARYQSRLAPTRPPTKFCTYGVPHDEYSNCGIAAQDPNL
jgi:hypothetical protein